MYKKTPTQAVLPENNLDENKIGGGMKSTGIIRGIDSLGRFVIPKELRKVFEINDMQPLEVFTDGNGIILKKYELCCVICNSDNSLVSYGEKKICRDCIQRISHLEGA